MSATKKASRGMRLAAGMYGSCPLERLSAVPADHIYLTGRPDDGVAAGADIFDMNGSY